VRIRQLELSTYLERVYARHDFDAAVLGVPGDVALGHLATLGGITGVPPNRLAADQAVAFLYHARGVQGASRRVTGVEMDLRGELATVARWDVTP
jgi:peptide/nickel transport system substrate-binding protein